MKAKIKYFALFEDGSYSFVSSSDLMDMPKDIVKAKMRVDPDKIFSHEDVSELMKEIDNGN
jgi:hypothetical protein